jgi:hypothetical protein
MVKTQPFAWRWRKNWLLNHHISIIKAGQFILSKWQIKLISVWKAFVVSEYVKLSNMFLFLQSSLRYNSMIDSWSRLSDVWPPKCCAVATGNFPLQSIQAESGTTQPLIDRSLKFFSLAVQWPLHEGENWLPCSAENRNMWSCFSSTHVSCFCAQEQLYLLHLLVSRTLSFYANWCGSVGEQTVWMTDQTVCELYLYRSTGAVSCDCVTVLRMQFVAGYVTNLKITVMKGLKIVLNYTW